jgi:hypothetical protein
MCTDEKCRIYGMRVTRNVAQELIVGLYMRLNGYFYSGFIVHAPSSTAGEIDLLAIRFPHYHELDFKPCQALNVSGQYIDIAICEIKGGKRFRVFNPPLGKPKTIENILQRVGLFDDSVIVAEMAENVAAMVKGYASRHNDQPDELAYEDLGVRVRAIMFRPDRSERVPNQPFYICGNDLTTHLVDRLRETPDGEITNGREPCDRNYYLNQWGIYEPLVRSVKKSHGLLEISELYRVLDG